MLYDFTVYSKTESFQFSEYGFKEMCNDVCLEEHCTSKERPT